MIDWDTQDPMPATGHSRAHHDCTYAIPWLLDLSYSLSCMIVQCCQIGQAASARETDLVKLAGEQGVLTKE